MDFNKKNNVATKIKLIIKWVLTILLLFIGLSFIAQKNINEKISGIILILLGCMACPKITEYIQSNNKFSIYNKYKKLLTWIFVIIFFVLIGISGSNNQNYYNNQINDISMSANESQDEIEIVDLKFNENEVELDIRETKDIVLEILPQNANVNADSLEFCSTDNNIAILEKVNMECTENKITLRIKPISEGECEVYAKNNQLISNKIKIRIIDKERIEKEEEEQKSKQEKESQEIETKQENETQKQKVNQGKKTQEQKNKQEKETQEQSKTTMEAQNNNSNSQANVKSQKKKTNSKSNSNNSHGKVVYRTPTGKRYHFDTNCGGKTSYQTTLEDAKMDGSTPCKKCAK